MGKAVSFLEPPARRGVFSIQKRHSSQSYAVLLFKVRRYRRKRYRAAL